MKKVLKPRGQVDLNLYMPHMPVCWFCCVLAHICTVKASVIHIQRTLVIATVFVTKDFAVKSNLLL